MTTIIAPTGEAIGSTMMNAADYAASMRRKGWEASVLGDRVYVIPGKQLAERIAAAERQAGLR